LIGRLLFDSKAIFTDQLAAVERASRDRGEDYPDLALLTDGLRAEREQGITIDVAHRYFATPQRKFIIADTPGHLQYTRNMVTGASTADVALVLVDARKGVLEQSRRHAFLASLLGIGHLVVCVNKMDLVGWSSSRFDEIREEFRRFAMKLDVADLTFVPVSALHGDNVVHRSASMPWYEGTALLHQLEEVHVASDRNLIDARFPVQYVIHRSDFRGYAEPSRAGCSSRVTRSWHCRPGSPPGCVRCGARAGNRFRRRSPGRPSSSSWPTTWTWAAGRCCAARATARSRPARSTRWCAGSPPGLP
jgi:bifunctional enzyme CysN/CysC